MDNTLQQIIKNITRPLLFFIPRNAAEFKTNQDMSALEKCKYLNHLYVSDKHGNVNSIDNSFDYVQILGKEKLLKNNIFTLLKIKNNIGNQAFEYAVEQYWAEVDSWVSATKFIKNEAKNQANNYDPIVQDYLVIQHHALQQHLIELQKYITPSFKVAQPQPNIKHHIVQTINQKNNTITDIEFPKNKTQKLSKPTEKEVDNYLLEQIFNVKL